MPKNISSRTLALQVSSLCRNFDLHFCFQKHNYETPRKNSTQSANFDNHQVQAILQPNWILSKIPASYIRSFFAVFIPEAFHVEAIKIADIQRNWMKCQGKKCFQFINKKNRFHHSSSYTCISGKCEKYSLKNTDQTLNFRKHTIGGCGECKSCQWQRNQFYIVKCVCGQPNTSPKFRFIILWSTAAVAIRSAENTIPAYSLICGQIWTRTTACSLFISCFSISYALYNVHTTPMWTTTLTPLSWVHLIIK